MPRASSARHSVVQDLGLILGRIVIGVILAAHGWQKVSDLGIAAVTENFAGMGIPVAEISAPLVSWVELIGGVLLVLGALTRVAALALTIDMAVAALLVHLPAGLFVDQGGWELVGALGAGTLILLATGPGRLSLDHLVVGRRASRRARSGKTAARSVGDPRDPSAV